MAERVGFEPTVPCGTLVFKTSALSQTRPPFLVLVAGVGIEPTSVRLMRPMSSQNSNPQLGAGNQIRTDDIFVGNEMLYP